MKYFSKLMVWNQAVAVNLTYNSIHAEIQRKKIYRKSKKRASFKKNNNLWMCTQKD